MNEYVSFLLFRLQILDPECEFHVRNRNARYEEASEVTDSSLEFGWLQEIINKLAGTGCIQLMVQLFLRDDLSGAAMAAILQPLSKPAQLYRPEPMRRWLDPCVQKALHFVNGEYSMKLFCLQVIIIINDDDRELIRPYSITQH